MGLLQTNLQILLISQGSLYPSFQILSLLFSWDQIRPVFNETKRMTLLGHKISDLLLLEMKQSKHDVS